MLLTWLLFMLLCWTPSTRPPKSPTHSPTGPLTHPPPSLRLFLEVAPEEPEHASRCANSEKKQYNRHGAPRNHNPNVQHLWLWDAAGGSVRHEAKTSRNHQSLVGVDQMLGWVDLLFKRLRGASPTRWCNQSACVSRFRRTCVRERSASWSFTLETILRPAL